VNGCEDRGLPAAPRQTELCERKGQKPKGAASLFCSGACFCVSFISISLFGVVALIGFVITALFATETKGRILEEVSP
jgi:hypothetical protein